MRRQLAKKFIVFVCVIIFATLFVVAGNRMCQSQMAEQDNMDFFTAKVITVDEVVSDEYSVDDGASTIENKEIHFTAKITSGPNKKETVQAIQYLDYMYASQPKEVNEGDRIIVTYSTGVDAEDSSWIFIEHNRSNYLIALCLLFFLLILIIGRGKGFATIVSLVFTALAIFAVYIPSILKGYNIYFSTIVISIYIILVSLLLLNGVNKKTLSAILGNIGGVAVAGLLALLMNNLLDITGIIEQDYVFLTYLETENPIDLRAMIWGGIVIGSLGAVMDVAMSIASAMNELSLNMENKSFAKMLKSGMNIGKDAIGTMTNTLILAYIGGALATVLLLVAYNKDILYLFNLEMIVVEVVQAVVGSMGILFAVPVTAAFAAYIFNKK